MSVVISIKHTKTRDVGVAISLSSRVTISIRFTLKIRKSSSNYSAKFMNCEDGLVKITALFGENFRRCHVNPTSLPATPQAF